MTTIVENYRLFDIDTALHIMDYITEGYIKEEAIVFVFIIEGKDGH